MTNSREKLGCLVSKGKLGPAEAQRIRLGIANEILEESPNIDSRNFRRVASSDLRYLMKQYDALFFDGLCQKSINDNGDELGFRISNRMTSAGGKTTVEAVSLGENAKKNPSKFFPRKFEIAISAVLLFGTSFDSTPDYSEGIHGQSILVAGVNCCDRLDALLRIFEHELVHLIEFLIWNDSSCGKRRFRNIARHFFGHQQSNHQLITPREAAEKTQGIGVGDFVGFQHAGHRYMGVVNHIHRRATVLVPDKKGTRYADGKCYAKYYVPLTRLSRMAK